MCRQVGSCSATQNCSNVAPHCPTAPPPYPQYNEMSPLKIIADPVCHDTFASRKKSGRTTKLGLQGWDDSLKLLSGDEPWCATPRYAHRVVVWSVSGVVVWLCGQSVSTTLHIHTTTPPHHHHTKWLCDAVWWWRALVVCTYDAAVRQCVHDVCMAQPTI